MPRFTETIRHGEYTNIRAGVFDTFAEFLAGSPYYSSGITDDAEHARVLFELATKGKSQFGWADFTQESATPPKRWRYIAERNVVSPDNDEHAAMAHVRIAVGENFEAVRRALVDYMDTEADEKHGYGLDSMSNAIRAAAHKVGQWKEGTYHGRWSRQYEYASGLSYSIARTEA